MKQSVNQKLPMFRWTTSRRNRKIKLTVSIPLKVIKKVSQNQTRSQKESLSKRFQTIQQS